MEIPPLPEDKGELLTLLIQVRAMQEFGPNFFHGPAFGVATETVGFATDDRGQAHECVNLLPDDPIHVTYGGSAAVQVSSKKEAHATIEQMFREPPERLPLHPWWQAFMAKLDEED